MQAETKPRYTVELTTEGWQIKDNEANQFRADVWPTREAAQIVAAQYEHSGSQR